MKHFIGYTEREDHKTYLNIVTKTTARLTTAIHTSRSASANDRISNPVADLNLLLIRTAAMTKALPRTTNTTRMVNTEIIVKIRKNPGWSKMKIRGD